MERLSKDISRIDKYLRENKRDFGRNQREEDITKIVQEYERRHGIMAKALAPLELEGDEWKPENDPSSSLRRPGGNHSYTTAIDYFKALKGEPPYFEARRSKSSKTLFDSNLKSNLIKMERYMERLSRDISRIDEYLSRNEPALRGSKRAEDITKRRNEYDRRYEEMKQALTSLEPEGDEWKPENNPDRNLLWRPEGDHPYTTTTDYLEALRGGRKEIEQYRERLSQDISRIDEYFLANAFPIRGGAGGSEIDDTRTRGEDYRRRYEEMERALASLKSEGDE